MPIRHVAGIIAFVTSGMCWHYAGAHSTTLSDGAFSLIGCALFGALGLAWCLSKEKRS